MSNLKVRNYLSIRVACVLFIQLLSLNNAASIPVATPIPEKNVCDVYVKDGNLNLKCASLPNDFSLSEEPSSLNLLQRDDARSHSFQNATLHSLAVANSTLNSFQSAFNFPSVRSLDRLSLENVTFIQRPSWEDFGLLEKIRVFSVYNATLPVSINSEFGRNLGLALQSLTITESNITEIKANSLREFKNLKYLRITHNRLKSFPKLFVSRLSRLEELRLDYNCIHTLEAGVFTDLPKLKVLSLSSNSISSLPENVFSSIWHSTVHIDLRDNPIKCDCRLLWTITSSSKPGNIIGQCSSPKSLFGKNLKDLKVEDLAC